MKRLQDSGRTLLLCVCLASLFSLLPTLLLPPPQVQRKLPAACAEYSGVFFGIFSVAAHRETRDAYRRLLGCEGRWPHNATVRFIVGRSALSADELALGDIEILNCSENMNSGKTYEYFAHAFHAYPCHAFYAKVDEDTAFLPGALQAFLTQHDFKGPVYAGRNLQREPIYSWHTARAWAHNQFSSMGWYLQLSDYATGMLYALNHAAVGAMLALQPMEISGDEDQRMGYWMQEIGAARLHAEERFHDHPAYCPVPWAHWCQNISKQSLAVHQCKSRERLEGAIRQLCECH